MQQHRPGGKTSVNTTIMQHSADALKYTAHSRTGQRGKQASMLPSCSTARKGSKTLRTAAQARKGNKRRCHTHAAEAL
eukprot:1037683-Pelagomonas_calceolata.AAC.6